MTTFEEDSRLVRSRLDLGRAFASASRAILVAPVQLASVIVVVTVLFGLMGEVAIHLPAVSLVMGLFVPLVVCPYFEYFAQVVTAARFLRLEAGGDPARVKITEVAQYGRIFLTLIEFLGRYLLCVLAGLVAGLGIFVAWIVMMALLKAAHVGFAMMPVSRTAHGWLTLLWLNAVIGMAWAFMSRYLLVIPLVAITKGEITDPVGQGYAMTRMHLREMIVLALAEALAAFVASLVMHWIRLELHQEALLISIRVAFCMAEGVMAAWFVIVKTDLAMQVIQAAAGWPRGAHQSP